MGGFYAPQYKSGVYSEYEPRFAIVSNGKIIGGSTYDVDKYNIYNFDVGILEEYQGRGMFKKLIDKIISDAKKLNTDGIKAQVINRMLFDYLISIGFKGTNESGVKYVYLDF